MKENKQLILMKLAETLQFTDSQRDLEKLTYKKVGEQETVKATYKGGHERYVTVTMNTGIEMVRNVVEKLMH